jgi:hypothetical protein
MRTLILTYAFLALASDAQAFGRRRAQPAYTSYTSWDYGYSQTTPTSTTIIQASGSSATAGAADALDEVNACRARAGLRALVRDPLLTAGAQSAAGARAMNRIAGHLPNDFAYLPPGAQAASAGCAAWPQGMGWGSCCTYEAQWSYGGAAAVTGPDGHRYMHLFVR